MPSVKGGIATLAGGIGHLAGRLGLSDHGNALEITKQNFRGIGRHGGGAGGAQFTAAFHLDRQTAIGLLGRYNGNLSVVDRLEEPAVHQPALEERPAPFRHRHVGHIGEHIDARHQPALKPEPARNRIVVHLVFGVLGQIVASTL
jgi:hypothetical protein